MKANKTKTLTLKGRKSVRLRKKKEENHLHRNFLKDRTGYFCHDPTQLSSERGTSGVTYRWDVSEEEIEEWLKLLLLKPVTSPPAS
ncbi:hypothetical protein [Candidatus Caldatribacterium sp.]|uniref:hypothetical protein n=1 Tax=Candidatus Caldatribacterium sp. TaxID=2282143 RepID=UPI00299B5B51|nr:hypothetical protein [Candidatus Calescibacterium sp.]